VRAEAAGSLGNLGESVAAAALAPPVKRLGDGTAAVRQSAAIALGSMGPGAGSCPQLLRKPSTGRRSQVAGGYLLGRMRAPRALRCGAPTVARACDCGQRCDALRAGLARSLTGDRAGEPLVRVLDPHAPAMRGSERVVQSGTWLG